MSAQITGWPTCAVCGAKVAELTTYTDHRTREFVIIARCHGDTETTRLGHSLLADVRSIMLTEAFKPATHAPELSS